MPAVQLALDLPDMARLDLTDEERDELARALREMINGDRFPLSQRVRRLKAVRDKAALGQPRRRQRLTHDETLSVLLELTAEVSVLVHQAPSVIDTKKHRVEWTLEAVNFGDAFYDDLEDEAATVSVVWDDGEPKTIRVVVVDDPGVGEKLYAIYGYCSFHNIPFLRGTPYGAGLAFKKE